MKNEDKQLCANCSASSMEFCIKYRCPYYTFKHYTKEEKEYGAKVIAFASKEELKKLKENKNESYKN